MFEFSIIAADSEGVSVSRPARDSQHVQRIAESYAVPSDFDKCNRRSV